MPQIAQLTADNWYLASQLFWLLVVFAGMYVVIGRGMLPKIEATVDARDRKVADDLAAAKAAHAAADGLEETYRQQSDASRAAAQKAVADTLVLALQTGRLPSGRHAAWGATRGAGATGGTRAMGPIEYLCAWHAQPDGRGPLGATAFDRAARALLGLVSHSDTARRMYCAKLLADADDPLGGAWSRGTRPALAAMARTWGAGASPERAAADAVDAFLAELKRGSGSVSQAAAGWIQPPPLR